MKKINLTKTQEEKIIELYKNGSSRNQIVKVLQLSESAIRNVIDNYSGPRHYKRIGERFGRLVIIDRVGTAINSSPIVRCQCDCGTIKNFNIGNLTVKNMKGEKSCGCYVKDYLISLDRWPAQYGEYKNESIKRGLSFTLTINDFKSLWSGNCFYCNTEPSSKLGNTNMKRSGIDRIDSSIGYELRNCVPCCWTCNRMKGNLTQEEFLKKIEMIYNWLGKKESNPHSRSQSPLSCLWTIPE